MKKTIILSTALLLSATSIGFAANIQALNKAQVIETINNKTITTIPLATLNNQLINNTFMGFFDKNGKVKGQFSNKPDNDLQADEGTWSVKKDGTLCATWQHWDNSKPVCVSVYKLSNGILFVNEGDKKFESLVLDNSIQDGDKIS